LGFSAQALEEVMQATLGAALQKLGTDIESLSTGTTAAGRELVAAFEAASIAAQGDLGVIGGALDLVIGKLTDVDDAQALRETLVRLGQDGKIAAGQLEQALGQVDARINSLAANTGPVADAFRELGIVSDASLRDAALKARDAFETIRNSGTATAEDVARAWEAYSERATQSGDAVLQSQAQQEGLALGVIGRYQQLSDTVAKVGAAAATAAGQAAAAADEIQSGLDPIDRTPQSDSFDISYERLFEQTGGNVGAAIDALGPLAENNEQLVNDLREFFLDTRREEKEASAREEAREEQRIAEEQARAEGEFTKTDELISAVREIPDAVAPRTAETVVLMVDGMELAGTLRPYFEQIEARRR